jgi:sigma-B regulation protein RsbU (phosphoserine phosphatase)
MLLQLTDFSSEPLYRQISRQLAERIRRGDVRGRLDSIRSLARGQRVSIHTVERAYNELVNDGLLKSHQDSTFVVPHDIATYVETEHSDDLEDQSSNLQLAHKIQKNFLPAQYMSDEFVSITASSEACDAVGGDLYDYFRIDDSRYGLVIADACGHGFPAALLISQIQAIIKSEVKNGSSLTDTMNFINSHIRATFLKGKFITLFYGIYEKTTGELTYINAGHNFPFVVKQSRQHHFLTTSSPALGLTDAINFNMDSIELEAGDRLVLYTDGITEAMNNNREEFGEERLLDMIKDNNEKSAHELVDNILDQVTEHGQNFMDDRTIMIFDIKQKIQKTRCA